MANRGVYAPNSLRGSRRTGGGRLRFAGTPVELEPIEPETAVELYMADRDAELAEATKATHRSRLDFLAEWCDDRGIGTSTAVTSGLLCC